MFVAEAGLRLHLPEMSVSSFIDKVTLASENRGCPFFSRKVFVKVGILSS